MVIIQKTLAIFTYYIILFIGNKSIVYIFSSFTNAINFAILSIKNSATRPLFHIITLCKNLAIGFVCGQIYVSLA